MTWFDGIFIGIVFISTAFAVIRGFAKEASSILAIVAAAVVAAYGFGAIRQGLGADGSLILSIGLGLGLFVGAYVAFAFGLGWIADQIHRGAGGRVDTILGGVFGAARGVALIGLGYLMYSYYLEEQRQPEAVTSALTFPVARSAAAFFDGLAPAATRIELDLPSDDADPDADNVPEEDDAPAGDGAPTEASSNAMDAPMYAIGYSAGAREGLSEIIAVHDTRGAAVGEDAAKPE